MEYSVSFARRSDELELKRLFLNCFDDTLGFVNMFFEHHFIPEDTVAVYCDEGIVGEAHMLPCSAKGKDCLYIYGVCISPAHRMQGLGTRMLEFMKKEAKKRNAALLLCPQSEDVIPFYEKAGFSLCGRFTLREMTPAAPAAELMPVEAEEYKCLRDRHFAPYRPIIWDADAVGYALRQETFFGFSAYKTEIDGRVDIVLCGNDDGTVLIKETTAEGEALEKIVSAVAKKHGAESVAVRLPYDGRSPFSVCGYGVGTEGEIYMNLLLE